jgi:hypothetical protein
MPAFAATSRRSAASASPSPCRPWRAGAPTRPRSRRDRRRWGAATSSAATIRKRRNGLRQDRGGEEVRRRLRIAHQYRSHPARGDALLQAVVDGGADLPHRQAPALDSADLPQARRNHPRPRILQLPRAGAEEGAGGPHRRARTNRLLAGDHCRYRFADETEIEHDGKRFLVRSAPRPAAGLGLRAAGVALPPTVRDAAAS